MSGQSNVRQASLADIPVVAPLFDRYRMFYGQASNVEGAAAYLQARTEQGESVILMAVAQEGEQVAGFVQLYPSFSSISMRSTWILNDLYVDEAFRQRGVARQLMEAARVYAEQTGAKGLGLSTAKDNYTAQRLYESLGYERDEAFLHYSYQIKN
ncbi:GNAT family N-acetyltransferase [Paenibacillus daejeonensis]|uniref:GNAT family N-acetyltransferase n=1 Tax=Paenibacillus daejeonensis TaxID=135193 RepID=UPI0003624D67|nr:GNAT family N-acetyltransferase [Paenibacillus daejeonensis]